jgi:hypothetical protein
MKKAIIIKREDDEGRCAVDDIYKRRGRMLRKTMEIMIKIRKKRQHPFAN